MFRSALSRCVLLLCLPALMAATSACRSTPRAEAQPGSGSVLARVDATISEFALDTMWDDGRAEVAVYDATRDRYGSERSFELRLITVAESFDPELLVKDDTPDDTSLPVLKQHVVYEMPTDNYPYRFATSVFVDRRNPFIVHKLVSTSSEWCGITTRYIDAGRDDPGLEYHSYFQDEADGRYALDWPSQGVTEEQLLTAVRGLRFEHVGETDLRILERQTSSHVEAPRWREATLRYSGVETVTDAAGVEHETHRVEIDMGADGTLTYHVSTGPEHHLIAHSAPGGFTMRLRDVRRWAYWQF